MRYSSIMHLGMLCRDLVTAVLTVQFVKFIGWIIQENIFK